MPITEICKVKKVTAAGAFVTLTKTEKCEGCKVCAFNRKNEVTMPALNEAKANSGDTVEVRMPEKPILGAPVYLYVIPLALLFAGIVGGYFIAVWAQLTFAAAGLAAGFGLLILIDRLYRRKKEYMPVIVRVVGSEQETVDSEESDAKKNLKGEIHD